MNSQGKEGSKFKLESPIDSADKPRDGIPRYSGSGSGIRVMMYMHDTLGLGRLRRSLKISRALKSSYPDLSILLVTGSPMAAGFQVPDGIRIVKLPSLRKTGDAEYEPQTSGETKDEILTSRSRLLNETARDFSPHIFLADHSHLSMNDEIIPCLKSLGENENQCIRILGIRGIIDDPAKVVSRWKDFNIYGILKDQYDLILMYTTPVVFDPVSSYEFPDEVSEKARYCGYIIDQTDVTDKTTRVKRDSRDGRKMVTVTIGGGEYWGEIIIGNFLKVLRRFAPEISFDSIILTGPFIPDDQWHTFQEESKGLPAEIIRFTSDVRPLFKRSDLVISTAGYNTVTDLLGFASKAIVIPRIKYRVEQLMRAKRFDELGLVKFMHPDDITPETLYKSIRSLLEDDSRPLEDARAINKIELRGTDRLVEIMGELFAKIDLLKETTA